ncbi:BolA-like protein [Cooperia oncophora]
MLTARARLFYFALRFSSTKTEAELRMAKLLQEKINGVTQVEVNDVSSGCGSMYSVFVESSAFKGLSKVAQHKMVTGILKNEIRDMHGLSITTKSPQ